MINTYVDPVIPRNQDNSIDWLGVKALAIDQANWYGHWTSIPISANQQIINLWYIYACLKAMNYSHYAAAAITSVCWFASGLNPGIWGTGRVRSNDPFSGGQAVHQDPQDPDSPILYYEGYAAMYPDNADTLQGTQAAATSSWSWVVPAVINPVILSQPSYGIVQWTPYRAIKIPLTEAGRALGEDWAPWWPGNGTLQMYTLEWQRQRCMNPDVPQGGHDWEFDGNWMDTTSEADPTGRVIRTLTWDTWRDDGIFEDPPAWVETDLNRFEYSCYQWLAHYIHAGGDQLDEKKSARNQAYNDFINPAFNAWDEDGGATWLEAPPGDGVWMDPYHTYMIMLMTGRRRIKRVSTIVF